MGAQVNVFLSLMAVVSLTTAQTLVTQTCSTTRSAVDVEMTGANAVIGGLFGMRTSLMGGYACGEPHKELIQVYEAARWALQKVNNNNMINGIKLGMKAYDTCSSEVLALKYAQDFYSRLTSGQHSCSTSQNLLYLGFVGPLSSWTTTPVAEMTGKLPVSVLSPRAMSTTLSDSTTYPYFLRTSPSSRAQAKAMIALLKELKWDRVIAVYSDSLYGNSGFQTMVKQAMDNDICITGSVSVPSGGSVSEYATKLATLPKYDAQVAIFFGSYLEVKTLFSALENIAGTARIRDIQWMVTDINLMEETYASLAKGIVAVLPRSTLVTEFREHFINLNELSAPTENPWLADWYMTQYGCKLPGVNYAPYSSLPNCVTQTTDQKRNNFRQNSFVDRTIMAIFAYAKAIRNAQQGRCGSVSGICSSLQLMTTSEFHKYLADVDFQFSPSDNVASLTGKRVAFDDNGDFISEDFTIWNYNDKSATFDFHEVGRYENGVLALSKTEIRMYDTSRTTRLSSLPSSPCPTVGCSQCVIPRGRVEFLYMPGDLVIGGITNAHSAGSEPLSCGDVFVGGMSWAVAFYYGIQTAKAKMPGILNGVNLGGLIVDICQSPQTGVMLFNNILAELQVVRDRRGRVVDPNSIKILTERLSSSDTLQFISGMQSFDIQELGTIATASTLSDKTKYPNYARVIPSDDKQAIAMAQFFGKQGWKFVQAIHSPDEYGRTAVQDLRRIAAVSQICIGASYELFTDGSMSEILAAVRSQSQARVIVLFLNNEDKVGLLKALKDASWPKDYIFVGTEDWDNQMFIGYEEFAPGFVSFQPQLFSLNSFESWIDSINPRQANAIPGFSEWYEDVYQCYINAENRGKYTTPCASTRITAAQRYVRDPMLGLTINAVYTSALALDKSLRSVCGDTYNGVCADFRASTNIADNLKTIFNNISFVTEFGKTFKVRGMEGLQGYDIFNYQGSGNVQVGYFNTEEGRLDDTFSVTLQLPPGLNSGAFKSVCEGRCAQCSYVYNPGSYAHIPGDIEIGGIFGIHEVSVSDPYICGELKTVNGFQFAAAVMYAIDQINSKRSPVNLNGVKLGGLILDHCNVESRRFDVISSLYSGLLPIKDGDNVDVSNIRAWVTDNTRSVMEVNEVVKPLNIPLVSPFATSNNLIDRDNFPTFFRTIQGQVTLSTVTSKLAKALNFRYVVALYSDDEYGQDAITSFKSISSQEGVCVLSSYKIDSNTNMTQILSSIVASTVDVVVLWTNADHSLKFYQEKSKHTGASNIVVIAPMPFMSIAQRFGSSGGKSFFFNIKTKEISNYMDFVRNLPQTDSIMSNPFVMEFYMEVLKCDLPNYYKYGVQCSKIQTVAAWFAAIKQDNYVLPTINAVYSFAAALDMTLREKCGSNYAEVCSNFWMTDNINNVIMDKMETLTFKDPSDFNFRYIDREGNTGMDLVYYDGSSLRTVGEFAGASLQISDSGLSKLFPGTQSYCIAPCTECLQTKVDFSYIPGDILIGGVFDVHVKDVSYFSCGNLKTLHGFQLLEAFHYAINKVNDKTGPFAGILKNIKLGGVGLDSCESEIKTGYTVSDIHNGIISLQKNDAVINPDDISAYIASYSSDSSLYLARILKSLKIPQISYGSTSIALLDQDRYPYFMRSVPADDNLAESMINFLDKFDIRYVQVVYSPNNYGRLGSMAFQSLAKDSKICIGQMIQFPDNGTVTEEGSNEVVSALLKRPTANTVVVFAETGYINALLQAIRRNPSAIGKYHFLGTETWGNNLGAISGVEDLVKGAVTWSLESADIGNFDTYLSTKSPGNYPQNPWFPEFYEDMVDCYLTVPDGRHPVQCASLSEVVISQRNYIQDPGILHVINSVFAAAIGIDSALKSVCGANYSTVCEKFRNDANRRDILMTNILKAKFNDPTGSEFTFTNKRDGNKGYQMYSVSTRMEGDKLAYYYKKIGTYSSDKNLAVDAYSPQWDGSCRRVDACSECPTLRYTSNRFMYDESTNHNAATLVALLPIHDQGTDPYRCGSLNIEDFYRGLSFFFTIQRLSNTPFALHGLLLDTCTNSLRIDQDLYNLLSSGSLCNTESNFGNYVINNSTIGGVITTISTNVMAANRVLAPLKIPLVGSMSSSVTLSDKGNYPYFARTVPPDDKQMRVISDILHQRNWTYVSVVYSRETYGVSGADVFEKEANRKGVCVGMAVSISYPVDLVEAKSVVNQLVALKGANAVVLITLEPRQILLAAKELGVLDKFVWIGTDIWGTSTSVVRGFEHEVMGAITVGLRQTPVSGFDTYITDLDYNNRKNIPDDWFEEFYQTIHQCHLPDAKVVMSSRYPIGCTKSETITKNMLNINDHLVYTTIAATYAAASAIEQTKNSRCAALSTFKECFENAGNWDLLFQKLLETQYDIADGFKLNFNAERYWDVGYTVNNYVMDSNRNYFYQQVGTVTGDGTVSLSSYDSFKGDGFTSQCPPGGFCNCDSSVISNPPPQAQTSNRTMKEEKPRNYFFYDETKTESGKVEYTIHYTWPIWAIATAVPTCVGLVIGIFVFFYFLISYPVRGGTTILGFMMIVGILGIYGLNFAFFVPASTVSCGVRRFLMGVVYVIVFAALLVKAIDNWRFSDNDYNVRKYSGLTSACSLFTCALGIVCVQLIIPIEWLILEHPSASLQSTNPLHDWWWCDPVDKYDYALVMSMILVIFLIILTAIFAALAWDSESNYYESRWIFVSCICTAGCFLVWMVVSTNAGPPYRDAAVALANFFNATALLICLPIRKLWLLFRFQRLEEKDSMKMEEVEDRGDDYSQLYSNPGFETEMFQPEERKTGSDIGF